MGAPLSFDPTTGGLSYDTQLTLPRTTPLLSRKLLKDRGVIFVDFPLESSTQRGLVIMFFFNRNRSLTSVSRAFGVYKLNFEGTLELEDSNHSF